MKQEPVAYITKSCKCYSTPLKALESNEKEALIPVYTEPQYRELSDEDRLAFTKAYFNIHPEAHLSEQFKIKLYELNDFAKAILKKASEK